MRPRSVLPLGVLIGGCSPFGLSSLPVSKVHEVDWNIYSEDGGSVVKETRWRLNASGRPEKHTTESIRNMGGGVNFHSEHVGFSYKPSPKAPAVKFAESAKGVLNVRYVFDWCGKGAPPSTVRVHVFAQCRGSKSVPSRGFLKLTDLATGKEPPRHPEDYHAEERQGQMNRSLVLQVRRGRVELRVEGEVETGGKGDWTLYIGSSAVPSPSYRSGPRTPPTHPPL